MRYVAVGLSLVTAVLLAGPKKKNNPCKHPKPRPQIQVTSDKDTYAVGEKATFDVKITLPPHQNMRRYAVFAMYPQPQPEYEVQLEQITPTHYRYVPPEFKEAGPKSLTVRLYLKGVMHAIRALEEVKEWVEALIAYFESLLEDPGIPWWKKVIIRRKVKQLRRLLCVIEQLLERFYGLYVAEGSKEIEVLANRPPGKPTELLCEGQVNPINVRTRRPRFSAVFHDPDASDVATHYRIQVSADEGFNQIAWDSGKTVFGEAVRNGQRCPDIKCGVDLKDQERYWWRIKFWDEFGNEGEWSDTAWFEVGDLTPPEAAVVEEPKEGEWLSSPNVVLKGRAETNAWVEIYGSPELLARVQVDSEGHWEAVLKAEMSVERLDFVAVRLKDGQVLVAGGYTSSGTATASCEIYDPVKRRFVSAASMHVARFQHTAVLLNDGRVLVCGGVDGKGNELSSAEIYDPEKDKWEEVAPMSRGRTRHAAVLLSDGRVLVAGGCTDSVQAFKSAEVFDPATGMWELTGDMNEERCGLRMVRLKDGRVLVVGGGWYDKTSCEIYDPATGQFSQVASTNEHHADFHTVTLLPNGKVVVVGGRDGAEYGCYGCPVNSVEVYDPQANKWNLVARMNDARYGHTATLLPDGRLLICGGVKMEKKPEGGVNVIYLKSVEIFDPGSGRCEMVGEMQSVRYRHRAVSLTSGDVLLMGGIVTAGELTASAEVYWWHRGKFGWAGGLADGGHVLVIYVVDRAGNRSEPVKLRVFVDTVPPEPPVLEQITSPVRVPSVWVCGRAESGVKVHVEARHTATGKVVEKSVEVDCDGTFRLILYGLEDGEWTIKAQATDKAGNRSGWSNEISVEVDAAPAELVVNPVVSPTDQKQVEVTGYVKHPQGGLNVVVEVTGGGQSMSYAGSADPDDGTFAVNVTLFENTRNDLVVYAVDSLGNRGPSTSLCIVHSDYVLRKPVILSPPENSVLADPQPVLLIATSTDAQIEVLERTGNGTQAVPFETLFTCNGIYLVRLLGLSEGPHTIFVRATKTLVTKTQRSESDDFNFSIWTQGCPINVTSPQDGDEISESSIDVVGVVTSEYVRWIIVNGVEAEISGNGVQRTFYATIPAFPVIYVTASDGIATWCVVVVVEAAPNNSDIDGDGIPNVDDPYPFFSDQTLPQKVTFANNIGVAAGALIAFGVDGKRRNVLYRNEALKIEWMTDYEADNVRWVFEDGTIAPDETTEKRTPLLGPSDLIQLGFTVDGTTISAGNFPYELPTQDGHSSWATFNSVIRVRVLVKDFYSGQWVTQNSLTLVILPDTSDILCPAEKQPAPRNPAVAAYGITLHDGSFVETQLDLSVRSKGFDFAWIRTYRSAIEYDGTSGLNWDFNYNKRIVEIQGTTDPPSDPVEIGFKEVAGPYVPANDIWYYDGTGRRDRFVYLKSELRTVRDCNDFLAIVTTYKSPAGFFCELQRYIVLPAGYDSGAGAGVEFAMSEQPTAMCLTHYMAETGDRIFYVLRKKHGTRYIFNCRGQLRAIVDRNDNWMWFHYTSPPDPSNGGNPVLVRITDTSGRSYHVEYIIVNGQPRVKRLYEDPSDFDSPRQVIYHYDDLGRLIKVEYPPMENPDGSQVPVTILYRYEGKLLTEIVAPREAAADQTPYLRNEYNPDGRITTQWLGEASGPGGSFSIDYSRLQTEGIVSVVDRNGNLREFYLGVPEGAEAYVIEKVRVRNDKGLLPPYSDGEPDWYETRYTYNSDYQVTEVVFPRGNRICYFYDRQNNLFTEGSRRNWLEMNLTYENDLSRGNLLCVARFSNDQNDKPLVTLYAYEPAYNEVVSYVGPRGNEPLLQAAANQSAWEAFIQQVYENNGQPWAPSQFRFQTRYIYSNMLCGDVRNDGNPIRIIHPDATLADGSAQTGIIETFTYDRYGRLASVTDPRGFTTTYIYHNGLKPNYFYLKEVRYPEGVVNRFEYDCHGNVVRYWDGRACAGDYPSPTVEYTINSHDLTIAKTIHLWRDTDDDGELDAHIAYQSRYFYDANAKLVEFHVLNLDKDGNPQTPQWLITRYRYDLLDNLTERHDMLYENGQIRWLVTRYRYDANENLIEVATPLATSGEEPDNRVLTEYDERDMAWRIIRAPNTPAEAVTCIFFDSNGNTRLVVDPRGNRSLSEYDGFDRLKCSTAPDGSYTVYSYDAGSNLTSIAQFGKRLPSDTQNSLLALTFYHYDELNRLYRTDDALLNTQIDSIDHVSDSTHDNDPDPTMRFSSVFRLFDEDGNVTLTWDDKNHRTWTNYDGLGRVISVRDEKGNTTSYIYDQNSNVIKTISTELRPDGSSFITTITSIYDSLDRTTTTIDNLGQKTHFFYDSRSNAVLVMDAKGNKSITVLDSLNRTITTKVLMPNDPQNPEITTRFWWDDNSRLLCVEDDNGNKTFYGRPSSDPSQTTGGYDQANRLVLITYPNSTTEHFSYDENDNITQMIDQAGNIITNIYDTMDRLVERNINPATGFIGTTREAYAYDGLGRIVSYYDNNDPQNPYDDSFIMCFYDSASSLLREVQSIGSHTFTIDSYYDAVGNRTQIRYPSGTLVCRCFDPLDRIKQIRANGSLVASYTYSGSYLVHRRSYPNNTFTHYRYDKNRRCILVAHTSSPQISQNTPITIAGFAYQFDAEDNRLYEARIAAVSEYNHQLTATFSQLRFFTYDDNYRITATLYRVTNLADFESAFNNQSLPPQPRSWAEAETFKNDGVYNIPEYTDILGNVWTRTVNNMNQYTQIKKNDQPVAELQYDACGNLTFDGERSFSYDYKNRLREVYISGRLVARYLYDAKDRRIAKIIYDESGKVERITLFAYDGWQVVEEYRIQSSAEREATLQDKPQLVADYVYGLGIDEPLRMRRDLNNDGYFNAVSETFFYYENGIGSIYALADGAGNVVERYDYTTYGEVRVYAADGVTEREASLVGNVYGFQGRRIDWETAAAVQSPLYYFRLRVYSSSLQRFLQPETMISGNRYIFAMLSPANYTDSLGMQEHKKPSRVGQTIDLMRYGAEAAAIGARIKMIKRELKSLVPRHRKLVGSIRRIKEKALPALQRAGKKLPAGWTLTLPSTERALRSMENEEAELRADIKALCVELDDLERRLQTIIKHVEAARVARERFGKVLRVIADVATVAAIFIPPLEILAGGATLAEMIVTKRVSVWKVVSVVVPFIIGAKAVSKFAGGVDDISKIKRVVRGFRVNLQRVYSHIKRYPRLVEMWRKGRRPSGFFERIQRDLWKRQFDEWEKIGRPGLSFEEAKAVIKAAQEANMTVRWHKAELLGEYVRRSGKRLPPHFHVGKRHIPLESVETGRRLLKFFKETGGR